MDYMIYAFLVREFIRKHQEIPLIVYDVDDVLWGLAFRILQRARLDVERCTAIFKIHENPLLTKKEQDYIIGAFSDASFFEDIEFFPGAADIMRPCELGAQVKINSNSFNTRIADLKIQQLLAAIPGLTEDNIQMNIIDYSQGREKSFDPNTTIFIDDSPHNVALSPAIVNVMPGFMRWSTCPDAVRKTAGKYVVIKRDLIAINNFVYHAADCIMTAVR